MTVKYSTGLRDHLAVSGSMKAALDGMQIDFYSGTEPRSADDEMPVDATLLLTVNAEGNPVTWEGGGSGMLKKAADETWNGTVVAAGDASWFRIHTSADDGSASEAIFRVQGSVGAFGADINLTSGVELEVGAPITLNSLYLVFLAATSA